MTPSLSPDFTPEIQVVHDRLTTTSLAVSKTFGKDHKNVLRDIQNLECPKDFHALNFEPMFIEVKIGNGAVRKDPAFLITRDGFTILAMGFTGKRAMEFKIRYIEAFNRMEEELRRRKDKTRTLENPDFLITQSHREILTEIIFSRAHQFPEELREHIREKMLRNLGLHFKVARLSDLPDHLFEIARSFLETVPLYGNDNSDARRHLHESDHPPKKQALDPESLHAPLPERFLGLQKHSYGALLSLRDQGGPIKKLLDRLDGAGVDVSGPRYELSLVSELLTTYCTILENIGIQISLPRNVTPVLPKNRVRRGEQ